MSVYANAADVLPSELLKAVQKHWRGLLYIPPVNYKSKADKNFVQNMVASGSHRRGRRYGRTHPTADLSDPEEKPGIADALMSLPSLFRHFCRNDGKIRRLF